MGEIGAVCTSASSLLNAAPVGPLPSADLSLYPVTAVSRHRECNGSSESCESQQMTNPEGGPRDPLKCHASCVGLLLPCELTLARPSRSQLLSSPFMGRCFLQGHSEEQKGPSSPPSHGPSSPLILTNPFCFQVHAITVTLPLSANLQHAVLSSRSTAGQVCRSTCL